MEKARPLVPKNPNTIFGQRILLWKIRKFRSHIFLHVFFHKKFTLTESNPHDTVKFVWIIGPNWPKLNWNKICIFLWIWSNSCKNFDICFIAWKRKKIFKIWCFLHFLSKVGCQKCNTCAHGEPFHAYEGHHGKTRLKEVLRNFHGNIFHDCHYSYSCILQVFKTPTNFTLSPFLLLGEPFMSKQLTFTVKK